MFDSRPIAEAYLAAWNETDGERRRALLAAQWSADARYVDPIMSGTGMEGIAAMIEGARAHFPGHRFHLSGAPDGHNGYVRFSWSLVSGEGRPVAGGTDIVRLDEAGRIAEVTGFLDTSPE